MNNGRAGDAKQARGVAFFDTTRTGFRETGALRFIIRRENMQFYISDHPILPSHESVNSLSPIQ